MKAQSTLNYIISLQRMPRFRKLCRELTTKETISRTVWINDQIVRPEKFYNSASPIVKVDITQNIIHTRLSTLS